VLASFFVIALADLEPQRQSSFGRYIKRMMTRRIEAVRFAGDIVDDLRRLVSFLRHPIIAGILIVLAAWLAASSVQSSARCRDTARSGQSD